MTPIQWISSEPNRGAYITLDSYQRMYLSAGACDVIGVPKDGHFALQIGYDVVNRRLVVAKPDVVRLTDVRPFKFDKRRYGHARAFVRQTGVTDADLPQRYEYVGKDYGDAPTGSFAFGLADYDAPDNSGRA